MPAHRLIDLEPQSTLPARLDPEVVAMAQRRQALSADGWRELVPCPLPALWTDELSDIVSQIRMLDGI